jgi:hypothetical protein
MGTRLQSTDRDAHNEVAKKKNKKVVAKEVVSMKDDGPVARRQSDKQR